MNVEDSRSQARPESWPSGMRYRAWKMRSVRGALLGLSLFGAFLLGSCLVRSGGKHAGGGDGASAASAGPQIWTCSMHPQIKLPAKGQCPICFMDLIPLAAGAGDDGEPVMALGARARTLARVETAPVERRAMTHELRLVGKVAADETRLVYVSSYIPGRIDRLFVDYTGIFVRAGDHLVEIYSPNLLVAQREYIVALESFEKSAGAGAENVARQRAESLLDAARRKLELWGIPKDELERLERERTPTDQMRIDAPAGGWVLERDAYAGMYVETGTKLFTLADLSTVWVMLDAYELDLPFLRYGQEVEFETEADPGRTFRGRIAFLDPRLSEDTRTVKVRLNVANENFQLRPGLFVRATVHARIGEGGAVIEPSLSGKWICPMHPEIVKEAASTCDLCGMDLVSAESLGLVAANPPAERVLAIPQTAVLLTGRRAVVYVETAGAEGEISYTGREVELGPRTGDWFVVKSGLEEHERVVTHGAFQIDSALQIQAKPSLMQPAEVDTSGATEATPPPVIANHAVAGAGYHAQMRPAVDAFLALTEALSADQPAEAQRAGGALRAAIEKVQPSGLAGEAAEVFTARVGAIRAALPAEANADIAALRTQLVPLTAAFADYAHAFGHDRAEPLVMMYCPMAFNNRGASWLQTDKQVRNPYFGKTMYRCGEVRTAIAADGKDVPR